MSASLIPSLRYSALSSPLALISGKMANEVGFPKGTPGRGFREDGRLSTKKPTTRTAAVSAVHASTRGRTRERAVDRCAFGHKIERTHLQRGAHLASPLISLSRILRQTLPDNPTECSRNPRRQGSWGLSQDGGTQLEARLPRKWPVPGCHLVEQYSERPDVASLIRRAAT